MSRLDKFLVDHISKDVDTSFLISASEKSEMSAIIEESLELSLMQGTEVQLTELEKFCEFVDIYSSQTNSVMIDDQSLVLEPFLKQLLEFAAHMAITKSALHRQLRDESNLLVTLTGALGTKYRDEDRDKILRVIEVIARNLKVSWCPPFLSTLIREIVSMLASNPPSSECYLYGLRIVCNIIFHNRSYMYVVLRDEKHKDIMRTMFSVLQGNESVSDKEVPALLMLLAILIDISMSHKMKVIMDLITETFLNLHLKFGSDQTITPIHYVVGSIYYMKLALLTFVTYISKTWTPQQEQQTQTQEDTGGFDVEKSAFAKAIQGTMNMIFITFFSKCVKFLTSTKGQLILESLLPVLAAFCANSIPDCVLQKIAEPYLKALNELTQMSSSRSSTQIVVLEAHVTFIDRLRKLRSHTITAESFTGALKVFKIERSLEPEDMIRNIETIRLVNKLTSFAGMLANTGKDTTTTFVNLLSEDSLVYLLNEVLSTTFDDALVPSLITSTCVVEVLNVMSKKSKSPTALLEYFEKDTTAMHISNCICNGSEELISLALNILGAVGFNAKCRNGVSKTLLAMKDSGAIPKDLNLSPEHRCSLTYSAQKGIAKLDRNLEMFGRVPDEVQERNPVVEDIMTWYKLKSDVHEMEVHSLNEHIYHLNRTITHMKALLHRQSEIATRKSVTAASIERNCNELKKQVEATVDTKIDLQNKHLQALESLKVEVTYQEGLLESKTKRLAVLEEQLKEIKQRCAKMTREKENAIQNYENISAEKRKSDEKLEKLEKDYLAVKKRYTTLEQNYKKSEEDKKTALSLLESEKRKTEIIQQVLGDRIK